METNSQYIIIDKQAIKTLPFDEQRMLEDALMLLLTDDYLVCSTDEPYAEQVAEIICKGEQLKSTGHKQ